MDDKVDCLEALIGRLGSVVVAFSGGTDSTLLLSECLRVLGSQRVLAVTADSPTLPRSELAETRALAGELGARHIVIATRELDDERFTHNTADRCYYCKLTLFAQIMPLAQQNGLERMVYGATADDLGDYRPGMRAAQEAGAVAPLLEAGFTKAEVRQLSRQRNLRTWDKPAMACLSSRIPYGTPIHTEELRMVEHGEAYLRQLGFRTVRVRHHGQIARIEVVADEMPRLVREPLRSQVNAQFRALGFLYVTIDLNGFHSGSMNASLPAGAPGEATADRSVRSMES